MPSLISYMKKLLLLALVMIVALLMSGIFDTGASIADTSIPGDEVASSEADNCDK